MTSSSGFELVGSVGPCPTDCSPLQVVEEPSSKFTSNCRTPPQAGAPNLLYGGGATCYRHAASVRRVRPKGTPLETLNLYALLREHIRATKAAPRHWLLPQPEE